MLKLKKKYLGIFFNLVENKLLFSVCLITYFDLMIKGIDKDILGNLFFETSNIS